MQVYSMTGYACVHSSYPESDTGEKVTTSAPSGARWQLTLELRSVNSRFLDLTFKFPEEFRPFEAAARDMLQKRLHRGKMELRAQLEYSRNGAGVRAEAPDSAALQQLVCIQDQVLAWFPKAAPLSVAQVLEAAGPVVPVLAPAALQDWLLRCLQLLVAQQLRLLCAQAQPLVPQLIAQQRQRFLEKWQDALEQAALGNVAAETANDRALAEAAAFALRIDVAEELDRMQAHLQTVETLLSQGGELGKRLDFLMQELHREANTFGSKSASLQTSHIGIDMKVLIEQMREQVQNIE
jgi:uncharacterized protein YicC (UPF0701 family)